MQIYLNRYGVKQTAGRKKVHGKPFPDVRFDKIYYFVAPCDRRHCAGEGCSTFGRTQCQKCDVSSVSLRIIQNKYIVFVNCL